MTRVVTLAQLMKMLAMRLILAGMQNILEKMRIEFEQKKKHLEELKEQKRLERLKHQSSSR